ncbi:fatty acid desaturase [Paraburkholderia bryophila]|uniref:Fatty acid desaturase n=1 Tax=Paraburkholderia bryophila TaxID=420952 RepID=A0A7Z0B1M0_9BURK|nr:fatty acid desaturase [Paraburkholderia bryophila]NYH18036.1 fatty acid desaturase [Paraburkholderia bryophila]
MVPASPRPDANVGPLSRPWLVLAIYLAATGLFYGFVTHFPLGPVEPIGPGPLDRAIPHWPLTVPLYLSYLLVMPALVAVGRNRTWLLPAFFAGALAAVACLFCHLFHPTEVVRPDAADGWLAWLYRIDSPLAASPSGHVALPVAIAVVLAGLRERIGAVFIAWSALLVVTVLTTGQHMVVDVGYGIAVGLMAAAATLVLLLLNVDLRTMSALLAEWGGIVITLRLAVVSDNGYLYALAVLVIATRQHALFILYHDATHYHLTRRRRANDFLINAAIGVPGLVPVEFYRPLHLAHHREVGTPRDPERQFLYDRQPWRFRPLGALALARQLLGDLLVLNMVRNMAAYRRSNPQPIRVGKPFLAATVVWIAIVATLVATCSAHTLGIIALLWFGPLLTLSVMIQKIRSMAEHSGGPHATPGWADWTYSWRVGWLGRVMLWPYHINLHLQHHRSPAIPWHALPGEIGQDEARLDAGALLPLLWAGRKRG